MTFFNKKEEVMKIELTPYGRYLLSIGKLKPHHYKFLDDNIIYDSKNMSSTSGEQQSNTHIRVTEKTPLLKSNPNITGAETNVRKFESQSAMMSDIRKITIDDVIHSSINTVGTNDYKSENAPHYKVDLFRGNLKKSKTKKHYTTATVATAPIPQLALVINITASINSNIDPELVPDILEHKESFTSNTYADGTFFTFSYENPIIRVKELNGFDESDNFSITAFKVYELPQHNDFTVYEKLNFPTKEVKIKDGILLDVNEGSIFEGEEEPQITPIGGYPVNHIGHFLKLTTDMQIPQEEICATIGDLKIKNIFLDEKLDCPDEEEFEDFDIYASRVKPEDLEDCD